MGINIKKVGIFYICLVVVALIVIAQIIRIQAFYRPRIRGPGSFATEKQEILSRRDFLADRIMTTPSELLIRMPRIVGSQFQGEWALYSCSMYAAALVNIAGLYPETRDDALCNINGLIQIVLSPELRRYDAQRWGEDPLETLSGDLSHISYLSHLTWMIGEYRKIGGGPQYDEFIRRLAATT